MKNTLKLFIAIFLIFGYTLPNVSADSYTYNIFLSNFKIGKIEKITNEPIIIKFLISYSSLNEFGIKELFMLMKSNDLTIEGLNKLGESFNKDLDINYRKKILNDAIRDGYLTEKGLLKIKNLLDNKTFSEDGIIKFNNLVKDSSLFSVSKNFASPPPLSYYVPIIGDGIGGESNSGGADIGTISDINGTVGNIGNTPKKPYIGNPGEIGPIGSRYNPGESGAIDYGITGSGLNTGIIGSPESGKESIKRILPPKESIVSPIQKIIPIQPINNSNDEFINEKLKEINDCFLIQYESRLKDIDDAIIKFNKNMKKSKKEKNKEQYSLVIKKIEEIKKLYIAKYKFIKNY